jgi:uncharacterized membrane protein YhfC
VDGLWLAALLALSALLTNLGAVVAGGVVHRRAAVPGRYWFYGALTFLVSQLVIRLPLQHHLNAMVVPRIGASRLAMTAWFALDALSAALFEEGGRWLLFRFLPPSRRTFGTAVMCGLGHGGFESIALVGLPVLLLLVAQMSVLTGSPFWLPWDLHVLVLKDLGTLGPGAVCAGFVERAVVIPVHVAASVLVMKSFADSKRRWLLLAVAGHFALNSIGLGGALQIIRWTHNVLAGQIAQVPFGVLAILVIRYFFVETRRQTSARRSPRSYTSGRWSPSSDA